MINRLHKKIKEKGPNRLNILVVGRVPGFTAMCIE
jgi:hypothetical protein